MANLNKALRVVRVAVRRVEFCVEYGLTGKYENAINRANGQRCRTKSQKRGNPSRPSVRSFYTAEYLEELATRRTIRHKRRSIWAAFAASDEWKSVRKKAIELYGAKCMRCGSAEHINVDHIKPKSKYPELALDLGNLQILCWPCNKAKSAVGITDYRQPQTRLAF